jgi:hypothetical protein
VVDYEIKYNLAESLTKLVRYLRFLIAAERGLHASDTQHGSAFWRARLTARTGPVESCDMPRCAAGGHELLPVNGWIGA